MAKQILFQVVETWKIVIAFDKCAGDYTLLLKTFVETKLGMWNMVCGRYY